MNLDIPGAADRRQTPRYNINIPVDIVLDSGSILAMTTRNISSCGLQIICETWVTEKIEPRGMQSHAVSHIRLKAVIELPLNDEVKKLYANCRVLSVQRLSQKEYMLNLAFIDFENGTEQVLDKFLDQYQQKKTTVKAVA